MNPCPNCGVVGGNFSCPNHVVYWRTGNAPSQTWMPVSDQLSNSSLFAEIGRLNVLLYERDKEIERLKGLMPPDERGPGFVGQGSWSVFAEKVVAERDLLSEKLGERNKEIKEKDKEIERLRDELGPLRRETYLLCNVRDNLFEERRELTECLRWYVENDDTNEGGKWEEDNGFWLRGKRRAMRALGMEEE